MPLSATSFVRWSLVASILVRAAWPSLVRAQATDTIPESATPASADAATPEPTTEVNPVVRALLVEAVAEYDQGHYAEAQALFRRAHELAPSARTLRGLGMAAFELRQYVTALRALEAALVATERPLTAEQRTHVEDLLARTRVFVTTIVVHLSPTDSTLRIDGSPQDLGPDGEIVLNPGSHTFVFEHPGRQTRTLDMVLEAAAQREISVALEVPPAPVHEADTAMLGSGIALGSLALLALVGATSTGVIALADRDTLASSCDVYVCAAEARSIRDRAQTLSLATDVLGAGAAAAGLTAIALIVASDVTSRRVSAAVACTGDGCTFAARGVW